MITFADVLGIWPFTLDELIQAFHDYVSILFSIFACQVISTFYDPYPHCLVLNYSFPDYLHNTLNITYNEPGNTVICDKGSIFYLLLLQDSRLLGEIHIALLRCIIKDIEDVARTPFTGLGANQNNVANSGGGHPHVVEGVIFFHHSSFKSTSFVLCLN